MFSTGLNHHLRSVLRTVDAETFRVAEKQYEANQHLPDHQHAHAYISVLLRGSYTETTHGAEHRHVPGDVVFHPAAESHSDVFNGYGGVVIDIELRGREHDIPETRACVNGRAKALVREVLEEFARADDLSPLQIEESIYHLTRVLRNRRSKTFARPPAWMDGLKELIRVSGAAPSLTRLAMDANVHPAHLAREFRRFHGCTIGSYIRKQRIDKACSLLKTNVPLSEVSLVCGFFDQSHFTRSFKQVMGLTPTEYRQQI
jgi:AraC family transcriptional regulator